MVLPSLRSICCCSCWPWNKNKELEIKVKEVVPPPPKQHNRSLDLVEAHVTEIWQVNYGNEAETSTVKRPKSEDEV